MDGTVIATDRCAEKTISVKGEPIDLWYSGKTRHHGGNIQALSAPCGLPLWVSAVEPGSVHDLTAARTRPGSAVQSRRRRPAHLGRLRLRRCRHRHSHPGQTPRRRPPLDLDTRTRNALLRALRCLGERGFALLTQRWRTLQRITASPSRIGDVVKAALVLTHFEHGYLK
ncbi:transposase family protein [Streptosporangium lutulentum]